jgi:hypothetical protein
MQLKSAIHKPVRRYVESMNEIEKVHSESGHRICIARLDTKIHPR